MFGGHHPACSHGTSICHRHRGRRAAWTANRLFWKGIASWAFSCKTATCVIDVDRERSNRVIGSLQIDVVMHDTFSCTLRSHSVGACTVARQNELFRRDLCVERLVSSMSTYWQALMSRVTHRKAFLARDTLRKQNHPQVVTPPVYACIRYTARGGCIN